MYICELNISEIPSYSNVHTMHVHVYTWHTRVFSNLANFRDRVVASVNP